MLAAVLGFSPAVLHYTLMTLVSVTTVGAFEAVGSVLVVAFMIGPPVTAYLLTDDLKHMLIISGAVGVANGILGYQMAAILDVSIAGSMAVVTGSVFFIVFIFAPRRGLISSLTRRRFQKIEFGKRALLFHLYNHEGDENESQEAGSHTVQSHLRWSNSFTQIIIKLLQKDNYICIENDVIKLTESGRFFSIREYEALFS
jgi:manganese/zinc/iron transport system permease protein